MSETNWTFFGDAVADVKRGVSAGFTPPNGGGNFVFGFNSQTEAARGVGAYRELTKFAPLRSDAGAATGGSISGAIQRAVAPQLTGSSVCIFIGLQGPTKNDYGYLLGLSLNSPSYLVLAKTTLIAGIDASLTGDPRLTGITTPSLRVSTASFLPGTWCHVRLDAIVNPNGDVVLKCFKNNLELHTVASPTWEAINGMDDFIDDALGINSGSNPLAGGYIGFGFYSAYNNSRALVDYIRVARQC